MSGMSGIFRMPKKPAGQFGLSCRLLSEKPFEIAYGKCAEVHVFENKIIIRISPSRQNLVQMRP